MKVTEPINEDTWVGALAEQDRDAEAHEVPRRLRGKTAIGALGFFSVG